jgi:endopeptidase La
MVFRCATTRAEGMQGEPSHEQRGEASHEQRGEASHEQRGEASHEHEQRERSDRTASSGVTCCAWPAAFSPTTSPFPSRRDRAKPSSAASETLALLHSRRDVATTRPVPHETMPIVGLLTDVVLPGEEHLLPAAALDEASLRRLLDAPANKVLALPIEFAMQLPSYVDGRVGTLTTVVSATAEELRLRGLCRGRVVAVERQPPHLATVEPLEPTPAATLLRGVAALLESSESEERLDTARTSARALQRATLSLGALRGLIADGDAVEDDTQRPVLDAEATLDEIERRLLVGELSVLAQPQLAARIQGLARAAGLDNQGPRHMPSELAELERRLERAALPEAAQALAQRHLQLLSSMSRANHDHPVYFAHLELLAALPWHERSAPSPNLAAVEQRLEREHFGLREVKTRILEYLALRSIDAPAARGMTLCMVGPPGVGKTSLARSVAAGLGRKLVRVALGGVHDESEIRGHRRSFVAATAGRIIEGMREAGCRDPVMLLDEIDKVGVERSRSPAAALLEVLDPEQHHAFVDNFLGAPFDLSEVLFITTANDAAAIPPALFDRLEVVDLEGYTTREKLVIARRHILPTLAESHRLDAPLPLTDEQLGYLIESYTREAGVRSLQRRLGALHRRRVLVAQRDDDGKATETSPVEDAEIQAVLGPPKRHAVRRRELPTAGLAQGLSVSADGTGSLLLIEIARLPRRGPAPHPAPTASAAEPALELTGRQGEVMREAARVALSRLRVEAAELGLGAGDFDGVVHVHLPEGAVPKDGPSAGLATYLALRSCLCDAPLPSELACTGELTLHGEVLAVGGLRHKLLAAQRAGIRQVLLPEANRADAPDDLDLDLHFVRHVAEAAAIAWPTTERETTTNAAH